MVVPVPNFAGPIGFNAQHSAVGAFMSFTCGHVGTAGGLAAEIGKPAGQDLFIGVKPGGFTSSHPLRCLPFFQGAGGEADAFLVEQAGPAEQARAGNVRPIAVEDIARRYGWGTDTWEAGDLRFTIHTPFAGIPDPATADNDALRNALLPAVTAELTVDNTEGTETQTAAFGIKFDKPGVRHLNVGGRDAFAVQDRLGMVAELADGNGELRGLQRWNLVDAMADANPIHQLGSCAGFAVEVPAGERRTIRLALGCYLPGIVTTGREGRYFYTRLFANLADVLDTALRTFDQRADDARRLDAQLLASGLSANQQFLIAHATRSYYGSTQLLDIGGEPVWVVNEGEYCMMNTLDLSVDQVFWELEHNPWVVKNLLGQFVSHYSFVDQVKHYTDDGKGTTAETGQLGRPFELTPGGVSFCHDMGAHNNFSPPGTSSYELADLTGCFSHMTQEQLCNWVLTAGCYVAATKDVAWAKQNAHLLRGCLGSLDNRRDEPGGFMSRDSARCGRGGEITTYDSLDESLGQARNNLYIAVKRWASYAALMMIDDRCDLGGDLAEGCAADLKELPKRLVKLAGPDGVFPAVAEPGNAGFDSRILAACEALVYPWYWSRHGIPFDLGIPETAELVEMLKRHTTALLADPERRNVFEDGGLRLSSTSNNSWMSKIALFQLVCRDVFHLDEFSDLFAKADAAHVQWQAVGSAYWACCDQIVNGIARGSRYYPRIITTALWMDGSSAH